MKRYCLIAFLLFSVILLQNLTAQSWTYSNGKAYYQGNVEAAGSLTLNPTDPGRSFLLLKADDIYKGILGSDASISGNNPDNIGLYVYGKNNLEFWTNGLKRLTVDGEGDVELGGTGKMFGTFLQARFTYDQKEFGNYSLGWVQDSWQTSSPTMWISGYGGIKFFTGGEPKMTINSSGGVGIGTTNPEYALDVKSIYDYHSMRISSPNAPLLKLSGNYNDGDGAELWQSALGDIHLNINSTLVGLFIRSDGNMGIGTENPTAKLTVSGDILAREIRVEANAGADFVFEENYPLRPLQEVEQFITENKHLPDISPADSMMQNGVNMGEMQIKLLQKIEELTLYMIEQEKKNQEQSEQIKMLKKEIETLKERN